MNRSIPRYKAHQLPVRRRACRYVAGIDPDVDKNGLIIYDRDTKQWLCDNLPIDRLLDKIGEFDPTTIDVILEAGRLNTGFHHVKTLPPEIQKKPRAVQDAYIAEAGIRVGRNFAAEECICLLLRSKGYSVLEVAPPTHKDAKWTPEQFMRLTGLTHGYNEEIRDAARTMYHYKN